MKSNIVKVALLNYPGAFQSSVHGLSEMFISASAICVRLKIPTQFEVSIITWPESALPQTAREADNAASLTPVRALIIPPGSNIAFCSNPDQQLKKFIQLQHQAGTIICSVCAGAFILASCGLLSRRSATTHWGLAAQFAQLFPDVALDIDKILINDGDLITAGGIMSWLDLGLELIVKFAGAEVMHQLGRQFVIDTGMREQRYYQLFMPGFDHGDKAVLKAQHSMQKDYHREISMQALADQCCLSERTFLRRFVKATSLKPSVYLQRLRVQKACNLLETSEFSFATITSKVGYDDISAFRKVFMKVTGLTPGAFRKRFAYRL